MKKLITLILVIVSIAIVSCRDSKKGQKEINATIEKIESMEKELDETDEEINNKAKEAEDAINELNM